MSNDGTTIGSNETTAVRPLGIRDKIGYLYDDLRTCFILGSVNSFLTIYHTNVLGTSGVIVGSFYSVTKLLDAFADVGIGRLCDTFKLMVHGRFNPWVRCMKYPFCIIAVILFPPFVNDFSHAAKIIYIYRSYFIYGLLLSTMNILYGTMSAAVNSNPDNRVSFPTWRSVGSAIGGGATGFFIPTLMYTTLVNGSQVISGRHFFWISVGCAALGLILLSLTCHPTTERVRVERKESTPVSVLLEGLARNKVLIVLVVVDLLIVTSQELSGTNMAYLFNGYFHNREAMSVVSLSTLDSLVLLTPSASWFTKRFGKKEASVGALLFAVVMYVTMYFAHITDAKVYLIFLFLATLGAGLFNPMVWAFTTDICDYRQYVTGDREDGTVYGVNFFAYKAGQACVGATGSFMLVTIGYQSSSTSGAIQTSTVQENIYTMANLLPALCLSLTAVIPIYFHPLNRTETLKMEETLNKPSSISK